jgi:hypothetical protein
MDKWLKRNPARSPNEAKESQGQDVAPTSSLQPATLQSAVSPLPESPSPNPRPSASAVVAQSATQVLYNATREGLVIAKEAIDGVPVPGLKGAIGGVLSVLALIDVSPCSVYTRFISL